MSLIDLSHSFSFIQDIIILFSLRPSFVLEV